MINVKRAAQAQAPDAGQDWEPAAGLGLIDAARGFGRIDDGGLVSSLFGVVESLVGEVDVSGKAWDAAAWSVAATEWVTWSGGGWTGGYWSDESWSDDSWSTAVWR